VIDLTELLEECSRADSPAAGSPAAGARAAGSRAGSPVAGMPAGERLAAVERRIVRRRRRRVAGAGLGVGALIVAVTAGIVLPRGAEPAHRSGVAARPSAPASAPVRAVAGRKMGPFAEYANGYRVVAVASAPVSAGRATTSWTVGSTDVQVFVYCPGLPGSVSGLYGDLIVDGSSSTGTGCNPELHQDAVEQGWPNVAEDLTVGRTATIGFQVGDAQGPGSKRVAAPKQGTIYLAVAERVPFAEFPLPPRPAVVHPPKPDGIGTEPGGQILHSDAADPQKTQTTKIIWRYGYDYSLAILPSTPGIYTVALDGIPMGTVETYDYRGGGKGWTYGAGTLPKIANGRTVTVTFTAQYATGPWIGEVGSVRSTNGHG